MTNKPNLTVRQHGSWTRVFAEVDGADASHLGYAEFPIQLGREASVRMAGIGGVGTDPAHRRKGLARMVFAQALEQMRRDGYHVVGLFTSRRIVAHRLYRQFGFVDIPHTSWRKLLNPAEFLRQFFTDFVQGREEFGSRRIVMQVELPKLAPVCLLIESGAVALAPSEHATTDLTLRLEQQTLFTLARQSLTIAQAVAANQLHWSGDQKVFDLLARAQASRREPICEG